MKTFRVQLTIGAASFVEADRWKDEDGVSNFYRGDSLIAHFTTASVQGIEEINPSPAPELDEASLGSLTI